MQSFQQLYQDYRRDVYHFLLRLSNYEEVLAEELTQETFYQAMKSFARFKGQCQVKTWLMQIAKNVFYQHLRKKHRSKKLLAALTLIQQNRSPPSVQKQAETKELVGAILDILDTFDSKTKDVMLYRLYSDLTYSQISTLLGISESSAKVIFFRGKNALHTKLRGVYGYEL
ncbi:MAG: polymerase, sigma-24 subunit, subfamily [Paenibacillaceae bacterium]|nr:polymerase, sigma-24 subunit, subfamily [Paenibacillaceae bacterium]